MEILWTRLDRPPMPAVEPPPAWSCAVQDLLYYATSEAQESMIEQIHKERPRGFAWFSAHGDLKRQISRDKATRIEYYLRVCHFIDRVNPPDGPSPKGRSVDRAEAKLWFWLRVFKYADY